ncbi:hypothetical protein PMIN06_005636 [Paraphaeosphaeria minitans]
MQDPRSVHKPVDGYRYGTYLQVERKRFLLLSAPACSKYANGEDSFAPEEEIQRKTRDESAECMSKGSSCMIVPSYYVRIPKVFDAGQHSNSSTEGANNRVRS